MFIKVMKTIKFINILSTSRSAQRIAAWLLIVSVTTGLALANRNQAGASQTLPFPFVQKLQLEPLNQSPTTDLRQRLVDEALRLAYFGRIPYALGGNAVGSLSVCDQCRACLDAQVGRTSAQQLSSCKACSSCGLDCSHFVERAFLNAGLRFRYADTATLFELDDTLRESQHHFVRLDTGFNNLEPGDLVLERGHMVLVVDVDPVAQLFAYVHSSSSGRNRKDGIEVVRNVPMKRYASRLYANNVMVLRHQNFAVAQQNNLEILPYNADNIARDEAKLQNKTAALVVTKRQKRL